MFENSTDEVENKPLHLTAATVEFKMKESMKSFWYILLLTIVSISPTACLAYAMKNPAWTFHVSGATAMNGYSLLITKHCMHYVCWLFLNDYIPSTCYSRKQPYFY